MSHETAPQNTASEDSQGLGSVPIKREPISPVATVPIGGAYRTGQAAGNASVSSVAALPVPPPAGSSKPVIITLSLAAAGLAAVSCYALVQWKENQGLFEEADAKVTEVVATKQNLATELKKAGEDYAAALKSHEQTIAAKDQEIEDALTKASESAGKLAEEAKNLEALQTKVVEAEEALQAKGKLESEIDALRGENEELTGLNDKANAEVLRLNEILEKKPLEGVKAPQQATVPGEIAESPMEEKVNPPVARPMNRQRAWVRLGKYETGENKGRWYFVAPDGYQSPLYLSRDIAIHQAELRAGLRQDSSK
jgi:predicted  nucleic acid-binding Zn-ribbon protein